MKDDVAGPDGSGLSDGLGPDAGCMQATPHGELLAQLMDPNLPKSEREHAATREIERLRGALRTVGVLRQLGGMTIAAHEVVRLVVETADEALRPNVQG